MTNAIPHPSLHLLCAAIAALVLHSCSLDPAYATTFARSTTPAEDREWAIRLPSELQTAGPQSLPTLTFSQGSTPLLSLDQYRSGRAVDAATNGVYAVFQFGASATSQHYVAVTNYATVGNGYLVQLPTIGTNTTSGAWWYTAYYMRDGRRYWTGNGRLNIVETTSTADGLHWQEIACGAEVDPVALPVASNALALASTALQSEVDPVAYPVATNALALASTALQPPATNGLLRAEADTLATVTARGGTTTEAVTIGTRGAGTVGVSSFANGALVVASGHYSHAEGGGTTASGYYSHAEGYSATASALASHASGFNAVASNITAFAWQGAASDQFAEPEYGSHGNGTYNLNPVGGLAGFWIGETTLDALLGERATWQGATNIAAAAVAASPVWLNRTGLSGTVAFVNDAGRPQAWSGTGALTVSGFSGLQPPAQVYWTLYGFDSVTLPAGVYAVGGGSWQTNMVNHFTVWQVGTNVMLNFITATEAD